MIAEGLQLMLIGMGVVFLFLTILVMLMTLTGAIVRRIQPMTPAVSGRPHQGELPRRRQASRSALSSPQLAHTTTGVPPHTPPQEIPSEEDQRYGHGVP
jgi:sodium pump decarboxylase gamma subunit